MKKDFFRVCTHKSLDIIYREREIEVVSDVHAINRDITMAPTAVLSKAYQ